MAKTCLVFLVEGYEEIETVTPIDILRRSGVDVTVAALGADLGVKGRSNIVMQADTTLDAVASKEFDCVLCPGGPGTAKLVEDARVLAAVKKCGEAGKPTAAICAAPTVLKAAGVLEGKKFTAHFSVADKLPGLTKDDVVVDGNIITSRGAGTATQFGLAVATALVGAEKAQEVSKAIMFVV